jgi:hypothetical protein
MANKKVSYIKTDENVMINESCIKWVKYMDDCLEVCTKINGCTSSGLDTHKICKFNSPEGYELLSRHFTVDVDLKKQ